MKYNKRIISAIFATILTLCFLLVSYKNSNDDFSSIPTENNSMPKLINGNEDKTTLETGNGTKGDFFEPYDNLITEWKAALHRHINDGYTGNDIFNFWFYNGYTNSIKTYYGLYDIDGNGIIEILFKKQNKSEDIIAYIFTLKDGEPINLFGYTDEGLPREVPRSRAGSSKILANGLIDCNNGDYSIYKIDENGYSVNKFASARPYDYPNEANKAEAKWKYYINETEADYDFYAQCLDEQGYMPNKNDVLANIDWKSID